MNGQNFYACEYYQKIVYIGTFNTQDNNVVYAIDPLKGKIIGESRQLYFPIIKLKIVKLYNNYTQVLAILSDKIYFYQLNSMKYITSFQPQSSYFDGFIDLQQHQNGNFTAISGDGYIFTFDYQLNQLSSQDLSAKDLIQIDKNHAIISYSKYDDQSMNKMTISNVLITDNKEQPYKIQESVLNTQFTKLYQLFYIKSRKEILLNEQFTIYSLHLQEKNNQLFFNQDLEKIASDVIISFYDENKQYLFIQQNNKLQYLDLSEEEIVINNICQYDQQLENMLVKDDIILVIKHSDTQNVLESFDIYQIK